MASRGQSLREIAVRDRGRRAAHLLHFEQERATNHPTECDAQHEHDGGSRRDVEPEVIDQRLEPHALPAHQQVMSAGQHDMRTHDAHRRIRQLHDQAVRPRCFGQLGGPCAEVAGELRSRAVREQDDLIARIGYGQRIDLRGELGRALAAEHLGEAPHVFGVNVLAESRQVDAPRIPERHRKQREHQHAERDVAQRESRWREAEGLDHVQAFSEVGSSFARHESDSVSAGRTATTAITTAARPRALLPAILRV